MLVSLLCSQALAADVSGYYIRYKMDDNAANSTVTDTGSASSNGTVVNDETSYSSEQTAADQIDVDPGAFDLDGSADYVAIPRINGLFGTDLTFTMWMKSDDGQPAANDFFVASQDTDDAAFNMSIITSGKLRMVVTDGTATQAWATDNATTFTDGVQAWHHIAGRIDQTADQMDLFVDGVKLTLTTGSQYQGDGDTGNQNWGDYAYLYTETPFVGARNNNGTPDLFWSGIISDFRIYQSALSDADITAIYDATKEAAPEPAQQKGLRSCTLRSAVIR